MTAGFAAFLAFAVFAVFGYLFTRFHMHQLLVLTFPALWILSEWIRTWVLTGFPWLFAGYGMVDTPLAGYAPVLGVFAVSGMTAVTAALLYWGFESPKQQLKFALPALLGVWALGFVLTQQNWTEQATTPTSVSLIQSNIPQDQKWLPTQLPITKKLLRDTTLKELNDTDYQADIVVWPEAAITQFLNTAWPYVEEMELIAREHNATIITGVPHRERSVQKYRYYNSIMTIGDEFSIYHKQKLVPFGEFIPWEDKLKNIVPFFGPMTSFTSGNAQQEPLKVSDQRWAPFICYEVVYPDFVRRYAQPSDVLITISNDAWFGTSFGPHQHFEMTRMRALETGRYLVRGTNTGITGVVNHKGKVTARLPQFQQATLRAEVFRSSGSTPFMAMGSTPIVLLSLLVLMGSIVLSRKFSPSEASTQQA